jgi:hypothetical protein
MALFASPWKKRSLVLLAATLFATPLAIIFIVPEFRISTWGWLTNEKFFMGKPTSYWSLKVKRDELTCGGWTHSVVLQNDPPIWLRGPAWTYRVLGALGIRTSYDRSTFFEQGEAQNMGTKGRLIPLLCELLRDQDPAVRRFAAKALGSYGCGEEADLTALNTASKDKDPVVRMYADLSLNQVKQTKERANR